VSERPHLNAATGRRRSRLAQSEIGSGERDQARHHVRAAGPFVSAMEPIAGMRRTPGVMRDRSGRAKGASGLKTASGFCRARPFAKSD